MLVTDTGYLFVAAFVCYFVILQTDESVVLCRTAESVVGVDRLV